MCFYVWLLPILIGTNNYGLRNWKQHVEIECLLTIILYLMESTRKLIFKLLKGINEDCDLRLFIPLILC